MKISIKTLPSVKRLLSLWERRPDPKKAATWEYWMPKGFLSQSKDENTEKVSFAQVKKNFDFMFKKSLKEIFFDIKSHPMFKQYLKVQSAHPYSSTKDMLSWLNPEDQKKAAELVKTLESSKNTSPAERKQLNTQLESYYKKAEKAHEELENSYIKMVGSEVQSIEKLLGRNEYLEIFRSEMPPAITVLMSEFDKTRDRPFSAVVYASAAKKRLESLASLSSVYTESKKLKIIISMDKPRR